MDWVGWVGACTGVLGLVGAAAAVWYAREAIQRADRANELSEEALQHQRGPEFAFAIERRSGRRDTPEFRLRNTGWGTATRITLEAYDGDEDEPESIEGDWSPAPSDTITTLNPGESLLFTVGAVVAGRDHLLWVFPPHVYVRIREEDGVFRIDMP